ncbi:MAG: hypothetical protein ACKVY0_25345 [Prosthecobacter sp.]|uniref:hypothetical protein n=1 Tax=Prosthecobacter sp. TaxID=1965333 RepID=UPI003902E9B6
MKLLPRLALCALLFSCLTSCRTMGGLMNSFPVKMLDEAGSTLMGFLAENESPSGSTPEALKNRARQVENRGIYAGRVSPASSPRHGMAAR